MANELTPWGEAIRKALESNEREGREPTTLWSLGTVLAEHADSTQNASSWRRDLKRFQKGRPPTERKAMMIVSVLGAGRETFPPAYQRVTLAGLQNRLEELEAEVSGLASRDDLRRGLDVLRAAIDAQASSGNRRGEAEG